MSDINDPSFQMQLLREKLKRINEYRYRLRYTLLKKMKIAPTMQDSETLRLVENDITFYDELSALSSSELLDKLKKSFDQP